MSHTIIRHPSFFLLTCLALPSSNKRFSLGEEEYNISVRKKKSNLFLLRADYSYYYESNIDLTYLHIYYKLYIYMQIIHIIM